MKIIRKFVYGKALEQVPIKKKNGIAKTYLLKRYYGFAIEHKAIGCDNAPSQKCICQIIS